MRPKQGPYILKLASIANKLFDCLSHHKQILMTQVWPFSKPECAEILTQAHCHGPGRVSHFVTLVLLFISKGHLSFEPRTFLHFGYLYLKVAHQSYLQPVIMNLNFAKSGGESVETIDLLIYFLFLSAAIGQRPRNYLSCCYSSCCSSCSPFGSFPH